MANDFMGLAVKCGEALDLVEKYKAKITEIQELATSLAGAIIKRDEARADWVLFKKQRPLRYKAVASAKSRLVAARKTIRRLAKKLRDLQVQATYNVVDVKVAYNPINNAINDLLSALKG